MTPEKVDSEKQDDVKLDFDADKKFKFNLLNLHKSPDVEYMYGTIIQDINFCKLFSCTLFIEKTDGLTKTREPVLKNIKLDHDRFFERNWNHGDTILIAFDKNTKFDISTTQLCILDFWKVYFKYGQKFSKNQLQCIEFKFNFYFHFDKYKIYNIHFSNPTAKNQWDTVNDQVLICMDQAFTEKNKIELLNVIPREEIKT